MCFVLPLQLLCFNIDTYKLCATVNIMFLNNIYILIEIYGSDQIIL